MPAPVFSQRFELRFSGSKPLVLPLDEEKIYRIIGVSL